MRNRRQPRKTLRKVIITLFIGMALAAGGAAAYAGYLYTKANDALDKMSGSQPSGGAEEKADDSRKWRPMTFLLTGIDSREGSGGTMNMDVMMLAALNPETHKMTVVSLPRDMLLKSKHHGRHKANYFFPYFYNQDKNTALQETKRFFSDMFEVPIDYMAVIDFDGFSRTVDELGGLKLDVDMDMRYTDRADGTDINLRKGLQELDGKQTLDFVRYRKSNNGTEESSDLERNARQQQVLTGLLDKLTSSEAFRNGAAFSILPGKACKPIFLPMS
ncbi:LCP family protein [Paenibacillus sp. CC-CFT747]|nr:LCP family protein [Paenibacillus sp. CC-CFT747]